jgi:hypothetical protein
MLSRTIARTALLPSLVACNRGEYWTEEYPLDAIALQGDVQDNGELVQAIVSLELDPEPRGGYELRLSAGDELTFSSEEEEQRFEAVQLYEWGGATFVAQLSSGSPSLEIALSRGGDVRSWPIELPPAFALSQSELEGGGVQVSWDPPGSYIVDVLVRGSCASPSTRFEKDPGYYDFQGGTPCQAEVEVRHFELRPWGPHEVGEIITVPYVGVAQIRAIAIEVP